MKNRTAAERMKAPTRPGGASSPASSKSGMVLWVVTLVLAALAIVGTTIYSAAHIDVAMSGHHKKAVTAFCQAYEFKPNSRFVGTLCAPAARISMVPGAKCSRIHWAEQEPWFLALLQPGAPPFWYNSCLSMTCSKDGPADSPTLAQVRNRRELLPAWEDPVEVKP